MKLNDVVRTQVADELIHGVYRCSIFKEFTTEK